MIEPCKLRGEILSTRKRDGLPDLLIYQCPFHDRCVNTQDDLDAMPGAVAKGCDGCEDRKYPTPAKEFFDRVVIINLERRPDRLKEVRDELEKGWPFVEPISMKAIDGKLCKAPAGYTEGDYAYACFQSHRRAIEDAINDGCRSVLVLEDDFVLIDEFESRSVQFMRSLPDEWEFAWLGGHHMTPPIPHSPGVVKSTKMDRCHAYAARGQGLIELYRYWHQWHTGHCDWAISDWMRSRKSYCAQPWLIGQRGGYSDITWSTKQPEWWHENVQDNPQHAALKQRTEFNLEAYPCKYRGAFKRVEKRVGTCALTDAPCFGCSLPSNEKREASLWQFCTSQEIPFCNRCTERKLPSQEDRLVDISGLEGVFQPIPQRHRGPFGGA